MRRRELALAGALALSGLIGPISLSAARAVTPVYASGCRALTFEDARFTACSYDLRRYEVRLFFAGPDGRPYGSLAGLARSQAGAGLVMAMNAGMYHHDLSPVGLYVEDERELTRANTAGGPGNFHMKPNGIFFVADGRAGILETGSYLRRRPRAAFATQSGPMLVIDGRLHPRFSDEGPSRKIRNGVGVRDPNTVVFAISDEPVSFGTFARLFRDALGCRDALFLDGSISGLHAPALGRSDFGLKPLGPMIGVRPR